MRISDWSSDVCSSDLVERFRFGNEMARHVVQLAGRPEVLHALGFQRRMTDAAPQALVIPHVVFQRRHVEVADHDRFARRSDERRVGKEVGSTFLSSWSPYL